MASFNRVVLMGNLTRDPEVRFAASGTAVVKIGLAVNRRVKKNDQWIEEANFFDAVIFGTRGEALAKYLGKGDPVLIEGELVQNRWEAQDGSKRSKVEINISNFTFVGSRSEGGGRRPDRSSGDSGGYDDAPPPLKDDDIPF